MNEWHLSSNQRYLSEYLITNGLYSYASSTTLNLNTRKYHGLLVVSEHKDNYVILSGIDERIEIDGRIYELGCHHYKNDYNPNKEDIFFPQGFKFLKNFEYTNYTFPKFYYEIEDIEIEKEILMPHGKSIVLVHYKIKDKDNKDNKDNHIKFSLFPLMNMRMYHKNLHLQNKDEFKCEIFADKKGIIVSHDEIKVYVVSDAEFLKDEFILKNVFYQEEWERGYDPLEDLYCPGYFFGDKSEITIAASMSFEDLRNSSVGIANADETKTYKKYKQEEILYIEGIKNLKIKDKIFQILSILSDKFIVSDYNGYGIIAGYHWFGEWGRDTMISIPGLCLTTKRYEIAKSIIKRWLNFMRDGLIPNFIPVKDFECPYNSSDASLWLFNTTYLYYLYTKDIKFIREIYQNLCEIIEGYIHKNPAGRMDNDSLIISNPQTTWMDTKWTKREGKCVEINALWYNALSILKFFSKLINKRFEYEEILGNVKKNFEIFWNPEKGCLYDVILNNGFDDSIRPNQIFAISLPFNVIDDERRIKIFNVVFDELYTPYGLRTLSKRDKNYKGIYEGNEEKRDKAYHNGTVWPFLIGGFIDAYLRINNSNNYILNNYSKKSKEEAMKFLTPLLEYAEKFGAIPEIFDGNYPHKPRGCIAQAWNIGEVLRAWSLLNE